MTVLRYPEPETPIPGRARRYVYHANGDLLAQLFADPHLTASQANPMQADSQGRFEHCHLLEGDYRVEIFDDRGNRLAILDDIRVTAHQDNTVARAFRSVEDLLADTSLSYSRKPGRVFVQEGDLLRATLHMYQIVAASATEADLTTAGGIKLHVLQNVDGSWSAEAFGVSAEAADNAEALIAMRDAAIRVGADKHHVFHWPQSGVIRYSNNRFVNGLQSFHVKWYSCEPQCISTKTIAGDGWTVGPREHLFRKAGEWFFDDYRNPVWIDMGVRLTENAAVGDTTITLATGEGARFSAGDRIFIHGFAMQKQGYTPNPKFFEWTRIRSVIGDLLTLDCGLEFDYDINWPNFNVFPARAAYQGVSNPAQMLGAPCVINLENIPQADGTIYTYPRYAHFEGGSPKQNPNLTTIEQLQFAAETVIWENVRPEHEGESSLRAWALVARESRVTRFIDCVSTGYSYYEPDKCCGLFEVKGGAVGVEDEDSATSSAQSFKSGTGCRRVIIDGVECDGFLNVTAIDGLTVRGTKATGKDRPNNANRGPVEFYTPGNYGCKVAVLEGNQFERLPLQATVGSAAITDTFRVDAVDPASGTLQIVWDADGEPPAIARAVNIGTTIWKEGAPSVRGTVTAISGNATHLLLTIACGNLVTDVTPLDNLVVKPVQRIVLNGQEIYPFEAFHAGDGLLNWEAAMCKENGDAADLQLVGTAIAGTGGTPPAASDVSFPGILLPGAIYELTYDCIWTAGAIHIRAGTTSNVAVVTASATGETVTFTAPSGTDGTLEIKQLVHSAFNGTFTPLRLRRI